jgi:uncharacterized FlaG/YvyC family protein
MQPTPDESDIPGVVGRRSARLSIIVPVTVRGTDTSGQAFKENTWTISVNRHGGRIATFRQLAADDQIVVENPLLGRTAKARVIRVCEKRFAEDPYEVCVELLEAQNVWGIKLPPEDWEKEQQMVPGDQKSSTPQAAPQAQETSAATAEKGGKVETAHLAPGGSPAEVGEHNGVLSQFNMAVHALSRFAGEANVPPAQPASRAHDVLGVPNLPPGYSQHPDALALKALQEKIDEAESLRQELSVLGDRVQSARAELENLLPKATLEFQAQCKRAAEQARAELDELVKDATTAADVRIRKVMEEGSPLLSAQIEGSAEQVAREQLEKFTVQIERARKSSEDSVQHSLDRIRQEIQAETLNAGTQALSVLGDRVQSARAELDNLLPKATLEFQAQCKRAAEQARAELDELVKDATTAADVRIRKVMEEGSPLLSARIEGSAEQVAREQLEKFTVQIERARKSSEDSVQHSLDRIRQEIRAETLNAGTQALSVLGDRVQSARAELDNLLPKATLEFQAQYKHAAEQARAELDGLVKDATTAADVRIRKVMEEGPPLLSAQIEGSAEQVAREQLEKFTVQIERARKSSEDSVQHSLDRIRQEIQAETLNAGIQARKIYKEESGTAAKAISVCVDSAVDLLNRAGDEAAAKLQASRQILEISLKKTAEECLPRLAGESASMLEKFGAEAQARAAQLQSEVESTTREFSQKARGEILEKLEGTVEGALELAARDLNKQAEDALELLREGLRSAQEQCSEETQKQLAGARQSFLTSLESEAGAKSASFRDQLHTALLEMLAQQTKEMEAGIQTSLQGFMESLRTRIQLTADESAAQVTVEVRSRAEQALQELQDRLYKGVGMAALVAKEWEEQAKTNLGTHSRQLLEVFQKELEALTVAAQERQRSDAEALKGLLRSRLSQAARLFEGLETDAGQSKGAAGEESGNSPFQSLHPSTDPL